MDIFILHSLKLHFAEAATQNALKDRRKLKFSEITQETITLLEQYSAQTQPAYPLVPLLTLS